MTIERALAGLMLAAVLAVARLEQASPLAAAIREGAPWVGWLALGPSEGPLPPQLFLAVYQTSRRSVDLVYVPETTELGRGLTPTSVFTAAYGASHDRADATRETAQAGGAWLSGLIAAWTRWDALPILYLDDSGPQSDEPVPARAKALLRRRVQSLPASRRLLRMLTGEAEFSSGLSLFDDILLSLEVGRLSAEQIRPAWLPEKEQIGPLSGRLLSSRRAERAPGAQPLTVEIFNASQRNGVASEAKKILRLQGVDVVLTANAGALRSKTLIYDRTGRFENGEAVRRLLGCPQAETLTQVDLKRLVDVTVILAEDCL